MVVGNAAITHPSLCHDRIETRVVEGVGTSRGGGFGEVVNLGIASVFLLECAPLSVLHEEEDASHDARNGNDTDNDARGDTSLVWTR